MKKLKLLLYIILSLFFISCENKDNEPITTEQILYTAMPKKNYHFKINNYSPNERAIITQLWEGLTELKTDGVRFTSVNKIEHSSDYKEWIFYLRDDLKWSDGKKIIAQTFYESWIDTLSSENISDEIFRMFVIKGAEDYHKHKNSTSDVGIKFENNILKVSLNKGIKNFDEWVSNPIFYPIRKENNDLKAGELIVNGAFKIKNINDDEIILEKNTNYWDSINTKLKEINISLIEDEIMAYEMFSRNEIDFFGHPFFDIPFDRINQANILPEKMIFPVMRYFYIDLPNEDNISFFKNKEIRKLMYIVSDPEFIGQNIIKNNSPAIFEHPHPTSNILNEARENFNNIKLKEKFNTEDIFFVAYFDINDKLGKRILLSTVKEWISQFKIPIKVTANKENKITFSLKNYLLGTNNKSDFYYFLNNKYNLNLNNENDFFDNFPVIPIIQKNETILSHSNIKGIIMNPSGDILFKYINIE